jgi:hypothetical protein
MANAGQTILDFGATPTDGASVSVADSNILATSLADAWLVAMPTANTSGDEHYAENVKVMAGNITAGVGFTIYGQCTLGKTQGKFTVHWAWY